MNDHPHIININVETELLKKNTVCAKSPLWLDWLCIRAELWTALTHLSTPRSTRWTFLPFWHRTTELSIACECLPLFVDCIWNVMAHAQKPDFVFRRKGRVHLNRQGASVQSTTGSRGVRISGSNAGYTMFRGSVKGTGYPLLSPVSPSLPLPCVTVGHHISNGV